MRTVVNIVYQCERRPHPASFARPVVPLQHLWSFKGGTGVVLQQLHRNTTFRVWATTERPNYFPGHSKVARRSQPCAKGALAIFHKYCCFIKYGGMITKLTVILQGILLICQNVTVWMCGAWIRIYYVLCSKSIAHLVACSGPPISSQRAVKGIRICETRLFQTSWHGNAFRFTWPFASESNSHRWIPPTKDQ